MQFDPFQELEQLAEQVPSVGARALRSMPMGAPRRGDEFIGHLDVPGIGLDDVDLTVERNVVGIRVRQLPARRESDEVLVDERLRDEFIRQLFLGDNLAADRSSEAPNVVAGSGRAQACSAGRSRGHRAGPT
jgi:HSP20 family protein